MVDNKNIIDTAKNIVDKVTDVNTLEKLKEAEKLLPKGNIRLSKDEILSTLKDIKEKTGK